jgi:hypothetical protein
MMKFFLPSNLLLATALVFVSVALQAMQSTQAPVEAASGISLATPALVCHPELQTYTAWVKPGNSLIPKQVHIKEGSERLDFDTGKSAFAGVRFADIKPGQKIQVMLVRDLNCSMPISVKFQPRKNCSSCGKNGCRQCPMRSRQQISLLK